MSVAFIPPKPRHAREVAATETLNDHILRLRSVVQATGLSRATIYRLVARGEFPKPFKLTKQCVGWSSGEISRWLHEKSSTPT